MTMIVRILTREIQAYQRNILIAMSVKRSTTRDFGKYVVVECRRAVATR